MLLSICLGYMVRLFIYSLKAKKYSLGVFFCFAFFFLSFFLFQVSFFYILLWRILLCYFLKFIFNEINSKLITRIMSFKHYEF